MKISNAAILPLAFAGILFAQSQQLAGVWQGTLTPPSSKQEIRVQFRISTSNTDGTMYNLDQDTQPRAVAAALTGTAVKFSVPSLAADFEGKFDPNAAALTGTLTGTWTQSGGTSIPLTLKRTGPGNPEWPLPAVSAKPTAMTDPNPEFDAVSIKPTDPATAKGKYFRIRGREFAALNRSVSEMMSFMYGLHPRQIVGAPAWLETEMYDVVGKPAGDGVPSMNQWKIMMQKVLADRFQLRFHKEQRELPVYAIQPARDGPKLTRSAGDPNGAPDLTFTSYGVLRVTNASIADVAITLQGMVLDRPVADKSGISGKWDFLLKWTPDETQFPGIPDWRARAQAGAQPAADAPPDLFTAFFNELGLKLAAAKAPVDVFVIDHVEKPSAN